VWGAAGREEEARAAALERGLWGAEEASSGAATAAGWRPACAGCGRSGLARIWPWPWHARRRRIPPRLRLRVDDQMGLDTDVCRGGVKVGWGRRCPVMGQVGYV
jgi:hypothetical protein